MDLRRLLTEPTLAKAAGRVIHDPGWPFPILVAKIKLTWQCNLRCQVCALWREGGPNRPLTVDQVGGILEYLHTQGLRKVHFSGGEPLLRSDLPEILARASELGLQVNLTTNGTLLTKEAARVLNGPGVHTVVFSIDEASERRHDAMRGREGAFKATWKGLERLRDRRERQGAGPVIAVNTVVTRRNIQRLPDLYALLKSRDVEAWRLLPVRTQEKKLRPLARQWAELADIWSEWRPLLTRWPAAPRSKSAARAAARGCFSGGAFDDHVCFAPWFSLFIDADGAIFPCCTGRRKLPPFGLLAEDSLDRVMAGVVRREVLASMASGHEFAVCRSCDEFWAENEAFAAAAREEVT